MNQHKIHDVQTLYVYRVLLFSRIISKSLYKPIFKIIKLLENIQVKVAILIPTNKYEARVNESISNDASNMI